MAVGTSSRTGFTRNADQRDEVLVWVSLHSQHQGICASLGAITPNTVSIILLIPPRHTPYNRGIPPYFMTFVKHFPWNVKTTLCQHWIWDGDSTAILDQLWCSSCVPLPGDNVGGHGFVLTLTLVTPQCHPQAAQGTGINSPPTTPGSRTTNIKWFQLKEWKERAGHWLVMLTCHDSKCLSRTEPCRWQTASLVNTSWESRPQGSQFRFLYIHPYVLAV